MSSRPNTNEDDYFARIEFERRRKLARETAAKFLPEERTSLREVPWLRYPTGGSAKAMPDRRGEIVDHGSHDGVIRMNPGELEPLVEERTGSSRIFQRFDLP